MAVRAVAEDFWTARDGAVDKDAVSPYSNPTLGQWEEVQPGVAFILAFGNVCAFGACRVCPFWAPVPCPC